MLPLKGLGWNFRVREQWPGTFVSSVARGLARARLRASTPAAVPAGSAAEGVA